MHRCNLWRPWTWILWKHESCGNIKTVGEPSFNFYVFFVVATFREIIILKYFIWVDCLSLLAQGGDKVCVTPRSPDPTCGIIMRMLLFCFKEIIMWDHYLALVTSSVLATILFSFFCTYALVGSHLPWCYLSIYW